MKYALPLIATLAALPANAQDPVFSIPLDCTLGEDCYINDYFDRDTSAGVQDYTCGPVTRDNHRGVDFALLTLQQMRDGVDVLAVAPGVVRGVRDELPDIANTDPNAPNTVGRECGNGLSVDHGNGWMTQYCHLKQGSLTVAQGDRVDNTTVLGQVGLSGQTNYPHLHFSTFKDRKHVDPFNPEATAACGASDAGLWSDTPDYQPGGLIRIGLSPTAPDLADVRDNLPSSPDIPADASVFIIWAHAYTLQQGDIILAHIDGPNGEFFSANTTLDKGNKIGLRFLGKRRKATLWDIGTYTGTVHLVRGGRILQTETVSAQVISQ